MKFVLLSSIYALIFQSTVAAPTTAALHVIGDSFSDIGLLGKLSRNIIPSACYWESRFSSGPLWNEYLALLLHMDLNSMATAGSTANGDLSRLSNLLPMDLSTNTTIIVDKRQELPAQSLDWDWSAISDILENWQSTNTGQLLSVIPEEVWQYISQIDTSDMASLVDQITNVLSNIDAGRLREYIPEVIVDKLKDVANNNFSMVIGMIPEEIRSKLPDLTGLIKSIQDILNQLSPGNTESIALSIVQPTTSTTETVEKDEPIDIKSRLPGIAGLFDMVVGSAKQAIKSIKTMDFTSFIQAIPADLTFKIPSSQNQINSIKQTTAGQDIAILQAGATDLIVNIFDVAAGNLNATSFIDTLSNTIVDQARQLSAMNFGKIIITDLPSLHLSPLATMLNLTQVIAPVVALYNDQLQVKLNALRNTTSNANWELVGLGEFTKLTATSSKISQTLGIVDTTYPCVGKQLLGSIKQDMVVQRQVAADTLKCTDPSTNYYFDLIHWGERIHRLLGYFLWEVVNASTAGTKLEIGEQLLVDIIVKNKLDAPAPKPASI
ncbi:hypothetical protein H4R22_004415 [Coemansia sp. RSA 1290]|nr:hypothetical protein H4R22_004415 [Coemansia sp. RSA 1290]